MMNISYSGLIKSSGIIRLQATFRYLSSAKGPICWHSNCIVLQLNFMQSKMFSLEKNRKNVTTF